MKNKLIVKSIRQVIGGGEQSEVELVADTETGETQIVITKTFIERYSITEYENVINLFDRLNRGGGRRKWSLDDLAKG